MDNLYEKEKTLWYQNHYLEVSLICLDIYEKTKWTKAYESALSFVNKAEDYKNKYEKIK